MSDSLLWPCWQLVHTWWDDQSLGTLMSENVQCQSVLVSHTINAVTFLSMKLRLINCIAWICANLFCCWQVNDCVRQMLLPHNQQCWFELCEEIDWFCSAVQNILLLLADFHSHFTIIFLSHCNYTVGCKHVAHTSVIVAQPFIPHRQSHSFQSKPTDCHQLQHAIHHPNHTWTWMRGCSQPWPQPEKRDQLFFFRRFSP